MSLAAPVARPGAHGHAGVLVVLEGPDRVGRSTHIRLLEQHVRYSGRAVTRTSLASSALAAESIRSARRQRRVDPIETTLLYAADLAERLDEVIIPALRAGLVVLVDRYVYTPMARAETRSVDPVWLDRLFAFAPAPDVTFLLELSPAAALARSRDRPFGRFESGMDQRPSSDLARSFRLFQDRLRDCFEQYAPRYHLSPIDASAEPSTVQAILESGLDSVLAERAGPTAS